MTAPTLGLAVIARDEESTLPNLLGSIEGAFDQVALLDTGSTDRTVEVFEQWADKEVRTHGTRCRLGQGFEWRDDFAAARNAAHALLDTDWHAWADCDDVIRGAQHLRGIVASVPPEAVIVKCKGGYLDGCGGRERLARRGFERWYGRVHEGQPAQGLHWTEPSRIRRCDPWDSVVWVHSTEGEANQRHFGPKYQRNMRIIEKWMRDLPGHPTPVGYRATEELSRGDRTRAMGFYRDYLALPRVRKALGPEHVRTALEVLPTITGLCRASNYVLGRPVLTWLLMDEMPDVPPHPICPDPGGALLELGAA